MRLCYRCNARSSPGDPLPRRLSQGRVGGRAHVPILRLHRSACPRRSRWALPCSASVSSSVQAGNLAVREYTRNRALEMALAQDATIELVRSEAARTLIAQHAPMGALLRF
jgi:hypothetical protein